MDQRREAGQRTRTRLMDAALDLLAERGEERLTLRAVTDAAGANVAAVSYHFGSLKSLCDASVEYALERYLDAQEEAVTALGPDSTLEELAAAFARPMMRALSTGGRDLDVMRIVARAGIDPPRGWERFDSRFDQIRADVLSVLKANLAWGQGPRADLPDTLRGRTTELARARTPRERAESSPSGRSNASSCRCLPEPSGGTERLTFKRLLDKFWRRDNFKQALDQIAEGDAK